MAREQQDREDLLKEATGLVRRAELAVEGFDEPVIVGFKRSGAGAIYFGPDPVYQFNSQGELRRGFLQGRLIKAEAGRLVSLDRKRQEGQVQMLRHELTEAETEDYLRAMGQHLAKLTAGLKEGKFTVAGQVPESDDVVSKIRSWLDSLPQEIQIADSPHAK